MTDFVFHPGLAKSGSSTLQRALFRNHPDLHYIGKIIHADIAKGCSSQAVYDLLEPVIWRQRGFDPDNSKALYQTLIGEPASGSKCIVGSWEGVGDSSPKRFTDILKRLEIMVSGQCKVLFVIRNPLARIPSLYLQRMQGHFLRGTKSTFDVDSYKSIGDWLKQLPREDDLPYWARYGQNIRAAVEVCGGENVEVLVFEQLRSDPDVFYGSLADFLNIDKARTRELSDGAHFNYRITAREMAFMRARQSSSIGRLLWSMQGPRLRRLSLRGQKRLRGIDEKAAKVSLDDVWRGTVSEDTADGNRWLQDQFAIDLESHGYPL